MRSQPGSGGLDKSHKTDWRNLLPETTLERNVEIGAIGLSSQPKKSSPPRCPSLLQISPSVTLGTKQVTQLRLAPFKTTKEKQQPCYMLKWTFGNQKTRPSFLTTQSYLPPHVTLPSLATFQTLHMQTVVEVQMLERKAALML